MQQVIETIECLLAQKTLKTAFAINEIADSLKNRISSAVLRFIPENLCSQGMKINILDLAE